MAFISRDINLVWILKSSYQMRITGIECWFNIYDSSIVIMNLDRDKVHFSTYIINLMFSSNIFSNLCLVISILKTEWLSLSVSSPLTKIRGNSDSTTTDDKGQTETSQSKSNLETDTIYCHINRNYQGIVWSTVKKAVYIYHWQNGTKKP